MKKIYTLASAMVITMALSAQSIISEENKAIPASSNHIALHKGNNEKTPTDTSGFDVSGKFLPVFAPDGQVWNFGYTGGGYVYGVNISQNNFTRNAQGYTNVNNATVCIEEVLLWFIGKKNVSSTNPTMTIGIHKMGPNKAYTWDGSQLQLNAPGPEVASLATATLAFNDFDTTWPNLVSVPLANPVKIFNADFAITANFEAVKLAADTFGFATDGVGSAGGANLAFHYVGGNVNGYIVTNTIFTSQGSGIDNTIAMFAVLEYNCAAAVPESEYFNGMKLSQNMPNPSADATTIRYILEKESKDVRLEVVDVTGKKVYDMSFGNQQAGTYDVTLDANKLSSGVYYYTLRANGYNMTKKMTVSK